MTVKTYLIVVVILLCIAVVNNILMYYKCYLSVNNETRDPFVPENIGVYRINIYYNKYRYPETGLVQELQPHIQPFKDKSIGRYVVTYGKPTSLEYQQISKLGNYQS